MRSRHLARLKSCLGLVLYYGVRATGDGANAVSSIIWVDVMVEEPCVALGIFGSGQMAGKFVIVAVLNSRGADPIQGADSIHKTQDH